MSAIFGIINKKGASIEEEMIRKMQNSLLHRAVDGKAIYTNGNMMFGHHKLIVHRRQKHEQQPLEIEDCIITCDARIDNIEELFQELNLTKTTETFTDPFIILQAHKKWGKDCVNHLEGEFCFAIWNKNEKVFLGASDHIGFRTFYYYEYEDFFAFASEIKGIKAIKTEPLEINTKLFEQYFLDFYPSVTYDKKINFIPSACYIFHDKKTLQLKKYWLAKRQKTSSIDETSLLKQYSHILTNKIQQQIETDYPVGIFLSGGLDSSLIAAIACQLLKIQGKKLIAFCSVLPDNYLGEETDEKSFINKLKERYDNLDVQYISIPEDIDPYTNLESIFQSIEEPANTLHYVEATLFKRAKELGVRTMLSGIGGDETISWKGHGVIIDMFTKGNILKGIKLLNQRKRVEKKTFFRIIKQEILSKIYLFKKLKRFMYRPVTPSNIPLQMELINKITSADNSGNLQSTINWMNEGGMGLMMETWIKHGHAYNIKFLSPIFNKSVVETFLATPPELFIQNGKQRTLIKNLMKNIVPNEIIERTDKQPFAWTYGDKVANLKVERLKKYEEEKEQIEKATGINFKILENLISNIEMYKRNEDGRLFYIPAAIIASEFYINIKKAKSRKNQVYLQC